MQFLTYCEVNQTGWDGQSDFIANFKNEEDAKKYINSKGINKNYYSTYKRSIIVYDSIDDYECNNVDEIKKRALKKLTPEEIKILNLS